MGYPDALAAAALRLGEKVPKSPYEIGWTTTTSESRLRPYQHAGLEYLQHIIGSCGGAVLADDMGLGKTRTSIALGDTCGYRRVLVLAPALARETWKDELLKWGESEANIALNLPTNDKRHKTEAEKLPNARWVISSYDLVERAHAVAYSHSLPSALFLDEGHRLKGRKGSRSTKIRDICAFVPTRLVISATPLQNHPSDYYQALRIALGPKKFGSGWQFDHAYGGGHQGSHGFELGTPPPRALEELRVRLSYFMVRREKRDVLSELPALLRQVIWVDADAEGRKALLVTSGIGFGASTTAALEATLESKIEPALELARGAGKSLLFTKFRHHAESMGLRLNYDGIQTTVITGAYSQEERRKRLADAQREGHSVVATIDSAGESLNLQGLASTGIMHALDWNPYKMLQAEARIHRMGQLLPVTWYYLACRDTLDQYVIHKVVDKMGYASATMPSQSEGDGLRAQLDSYGNGAGITPDEAARALYEAFGDDNE